MDSSGPVNGERRNDGVDTRAVGQTRINHRRAFVDSPADAAHDAVDHPKQMLVVLERSSDALQHTSSLDEHAAVRVHQNVVDARIPQQRLERSQAEHIVEHFGEQRFALAEADRRRLLAEQLAEKSSDLAFGAVAISSVRASRFSCASSFR